MIRSLADCRWPEIAPPYDSALREAVAYVLMHYDVVGILVAGSVLRGATDERSDLDIHVIHTRPLRQRVHRYFHGVPTEIFISPATAVGETFAADHARRAPSWAHMFVHGHTVLELDPTLARLREEAAGWLARPPGRGIPMTDWDRHFVLKDLDDARGLAASEPACAALLLARAVLGMLQLYMRAAGGFLPQAKETLSALSALDPVAGELARQFFVAVSSGERFHCAEAIAQHTLGTDRFFEWTSEPEPVGT